MNVNLSLSRHQTKQRQFAPFWPSVRADVVRLFGCYSLRRLLWAFLVVRTFRPIFTLRLCQAASSLPRPIGGLFLFPCRVLHFWTQQWAGLDLPWRSKIGPGFVITHGWGLVITHGAKFGSNVTVYHGTTIGQKDKIRPNGRTTSFPIIEDEVWIGPHAVITGGVVIGRGSRIAAGTIVTGDVKPYSIVGGNPMRVLKTNALPDVVKPANLSS